jgi:uncharacterized protein YcfJ
MAHSSHSTNSTHSRRRSHSYHYTKREKIRSSGGSTIAGAVCGGIIGYQLSDGDTMISVIGTVLGALGLKRIKKKAL